MVMLEMKKFVWAFLGARHYEAINVIKKLINVAFLVCCYVNSTFLVQVSHKDERFNIVHNDKLCAPFNHFRLCCDSHFVLC